MTTPSPSAPDPKRRVILRAALPPQPRALEPVPGLRPFSADDRPALGGLLFEAYLGTVDQEEETPEQAHQEIDKTLSGAYGHFLPGCSWVVQAPEEAERPGELRSAILLTMFRGRPFIAFVFTRPGSQNQGLARACIQAAMASLQADGEHELHLVVTRANAPAMHLYQALGFQEERDA